MIVGRDSFKKNDSTSLAISTQCLVGGGKSSALVLLFQHSRCYAANIRYQFMAYFLTYGNLFLLIFWRGAATGIYLRITIIENANGRSLDTICGDDG